MLPRTFIVTCLISFRFQAMPIDAWPTLQMTILNYSITYNVEYVTYTMVPSNISDEAYDIHMNVLKENVRPFVKLGIYFENVEFMNKTIDLCKVVHSSKNVEPLLKLIAQVALDKEKSRIPNGCPVKRGKYYNFLRRIETDKIPPVWPEKKVSLYIHMFAMESERLIPILTQSVHCQLYKKKSVV